MATIVDYNEKKADIEGDYYYALGAYKNIQESKKNKWYVVKPEDDIATVRIKNGARDNLLSQMGNIVEHCLKYFYKLNIMKDYPTISLSQFEKIIQLQKGELRNTYHDPAKVDDIFGNNNNRIQSSTATTHEDYGPASHDLQHILATIIDKYYPNTKSLINELQIEEAKSKLISQMTPEDYISIFGVKAEEQIIKDSLAPYYCFPSLLFESDLVISRTLEINYLGKIRNQLHDRYLVLEQARDAFTRFRYYNNNKERKVLDVDEVYFMTRGFLNAVEMTHLSKDNIDVNPKVAFARYYLKTHPEFKDKWVYYNDEDIEKIFEMDEIKDNVKVIAASLFYNNNLTPEDIKKIVTSPEIDEKDYIEIICYGLTLDTIKFFRDNGIYNYDTMQSELLGEKDAEDRLIAILFGNYCSIEDYKRKREQLTLQSGELVYNIIDDSFDKEALAAIKNEPETYRYISNKNYNKQRKYYFPYGFVNELLKIDELKDNKEAWFGLDLNQLLSFELINYALDYSDRIEKLMTKENILNNIKANIELFKNNPKMLSYIPLMVNSHDISKIYEILKSYNLTDEQIMKIDSSVFCMPVELIESFKFFGPDSDYSIIKDGALNPRIINKIKDRYMKNIYDRYIVRDKIISPHEENDNETLEQVVLMREERKQIYKNIKNNFKGIFNLEKSKKPQF